MAFYRMTEKSFSEALSSTSTHNNGIEGEPTRFLECLQKRASITSPRIDETAPASQPADNSKTGNREQRANSLASPFSFAGSLWTCSSSESVTTLNPVSSMGTAASTLNAALDWSTPTPTIENTPRRASLATSTANASWKCVGSGTGIVEDHPSQPAVAGTSNRQRSASLSTTSFASIVTQDTTTTATSTGDDGNDNLLDPVDEAVELFKRTSMDSLLDFPSTSVTSSATAFGQSNLLSGLSAAQRRHSLNWISSSSSNKPSLFDDLTSFTTTTATTPIEFQVVDGAESFMPSLPSSPEFDTFPEDFMATTAATSSNFSKKRFARRHSIATDMALEESFASALSFEHQQQQQHIQNNSYPFNGNVMAAYSGLLNGEESASNTMSAVPTVHGVNETIMNSMLKYAAASVTSAATPAQAGIAPTALSFPHASFNLSAHKGLLFLIEFKAGRTEIFYVLDADVALSVKLGDLVIVEADRGEDLGRITGEMPSSRIRQLIAQLPHDSLASALASQFDDSVAANGANVNHNLAGLKDFEIAALIASKEISLKRIHRHASPLDVRFLQAKAQEEALAMVRCQARIKQKKLPMEVVDAEYQW